MARMKFICDAERCIECNGCTTACKNEHEVPWGVNRRRLVTVNDGLPGERSISVACLRGKMDKCTFCAGGPEENHSVEEFRKYGRNRIAEGKLPACAEMCSTKALLAGDAPVIATIYKTRVTTRGKGDEIWGWAVAYQGSGKLADQPGVTL